MIKHRNLSSRLRHRLTLQQEQRSLDDIGGYVRSWQDVANIWAEIIPVVSISNTERSSGREQVAAGKIMSELSHRIIIRYRDDIDTSMRLVYENRHFNIRSIVNVNERKEWIEIMAQEGVAA